MRLMKIGMLVILLQVLCTGCWDLRDINKLAIITVLGFDKITAEDGDDKFQVSVLVMQAGRAVGGGGSENESKAEIVWTGEGLTISEAILDIMERSPSTPFFADAYSVIIGQRAAEEELLVIIDYLNRLREQRPGAFVMIAKGNAYPLFEAEPELSPTASRELKGLIQNVEDLKGIGRGVRLIEFTEDLLSSDRDPVAAVVRLIHTEEKRGEELAGPPKVILVEGLAVFKEDKLVGWLNKEEAVGYNLLTGKITRGDIVVRVKKDGKWFVYLVEKSKPKIKASLIEDKLNIDIIIETKGRITEDNGVNLEPSDIEEIEDAVAEQIGQMVMQTIETVRGYESDCLGFSERLHRYKLKDWKKVEEHWRETFLEANVELRVNAIVENTGRLGQRLEMNK